MGTSAGKKKKRKWSQALPSVAVKRGRGLQSAHRWTPSAFQVKKSRLESSPGQLRFQLSSPPPSHRSTISSKWIWSSRWQNVSPILPEALAGRTSDWNRKCASYHNRRKEFKWHSDKLERTFYGFAVSPNVLLCFFLAQFFFFFQWIVLCILIG